MQLDCGHLFEVKQFDKWMASTVRESDVIKLIRCPAKNCGEVLYRNFGFNQIIKVVNNHILQIQDPILKKQMSPMQIFCNILQSV